MIPKKLEILVQKVGSTEHRVAVVTADMYQPKQYGQDCNRGHLPTAVVPMPHPHDGFVLHVRVVE